MENKKRLIDANEYPCQTCDVSYCHQNCAKFIAWFEKTVDAVELPPIKVGDTAYFIINRKIYKAEVYYIRWEHHKRYGIHSEISANVGQYSSVGASFDDFGKTVFLTKEEAEAGLAKMDGGNEDGNL